MAGDPINRLNSPYWCTSPNPKSDFPPGYFDLVFVFNGLKWEVVVLSVNICFTITVLTILLKK